MKIEIVGIAEFERGGVLNHIIGDQATIDWLEDLCELS